MKLKGKHYFGIFWILFYAMIILISLGYNHKARLIPLLVSIPCLIFALYRFYVDLSGKEEKGVTTEDVRLPGGKDGAEGAAGGFKQQEKETLSKEEKKRRLFDILLWIAIFLALIFAVGFLIAIPVFTLAYMRVKKESWLVAGLSAAGLTAGVYLAFVIGTESYLYEGLLIPLIKSALQ